VETTNSVISYKGFDKNWRCRGFQYEVGKSYTHDGDIKACRSGFHACEYPLDVFNYYPPAQNRFAVVEQAGELHREGRDSKVTSETISIVAEVSIAELISAAIEYTKSRCKPVDENSPTSATGDQGAASATGYQGAASATGALGAASATGHQGAASATGHQGAASATGYQGAASATGALGAASATGHQGAASATGYQGAASATGALGAASATGHQGAASATGYRGAASATGDQGAASATGHQGAASATGHQGAASATGYQGAASVENKASVASSTGGCGRAKASNGSAIVLVYREDNGDITHIRSSKVGENGVKPDVWYTLDSEGNFVEVRDEP
jgi:hypothetical protein